MLFILLLILFMLVFGLNPPGWLKKSRRGHAPMGYRHDPLGEESEAPFIEMSPGVWINRYTGKEVKMKTMSLREFIEEGRKACDRQAEEKNE